jgi:hypothetical protein
LCKVFCCFLTRLKPRLFFNTRIIFVSDASELEFIENVETFLMILKYLLVWLGITCQYFFLFELLSHFGLTHETIKPAQLWHFFVLFLLVKTIISEIFISILLWEDLSLVRFYLFVFQLTFRFTNLFVYARRT